MTSLITGSVAPSAAVGSAGDFYIDTATSITYGPKAGSTWPVASRSRKAARSYASRLTLQQSGSGGGGGTTVVNGYPPDYASLTGSTFTGAVHAQLTGSLTRTSAGTPFITAPSGNVITVSTGSNGQVILSGSGGTLHPGGSTGQLQFNNTGTFGGIAGATYNGAVLNLALPVTASLGLSASLGVQLNNNRPITWSDSAGTGSVQGLIITNNNNLLLGHGSMPGDLYLRCSGSKTIRLEVGASEVKAIFANTAVQFNADSHFGFTANGVTPIYDLSAAAFKSFVHMTGSSAGFSNYLSVGDNPSTQGQLRLTALADVSAGVYARNVERTANLHLISTDGTTGQNNIDVGDYVNSAVLNVGANQRINLVLGVSGSQYASLDTSYFRLQRLALADSDNTTQYVFSASNLAAQRGVILPALSASSDTFVFESQAQTLANKTFTSPTLTNPTITGGGSWSGSPTITSPTINSGSATNLSFLSLGANPSSTGLLRLSNNDYVKARVAANNADIFVAGTNASNQVVLGAGANPAGTYLQGAGFVVVNGDTVYLRSSNDGTTRAQLGGAATDYVAVGAIPATTGSLRLPADGMINFRSGSNAANVTALKLDTFGRLLVGGDDFNATNGPTRTYVMSTTETYVGALNAILRFDANGCTLVNGAIYTTGGTAASTGQIRLGQNNSIVGRGNSADIGIAALASNDLHVGRDAVGGSQASNLYLNASTGLFLQVNGATRLQVTGSAVLCNLPLTASNGISGSFGAFTSSSVVTDSVPFGRFVDPATTGHRLTITSASAVPSSDVLSGSTVYLTPHVSDRIALYDGTRWVERNTSNTQVSIALSSLTINKNYDVFAYDSSGTVTLELSNAWTDDTTRSQALTRRDGVLVKSGAETRKYVGTIRTQAANSTSDSESKRFVWNFYNRVQRFLKVTDSTASWTYTTTATWRQVRASTANKVEVVTGAEGSLVEIAALAEASAASTNLGFGAGVGVNVTNANSAQVWGGACSPASTVTFGNSQYRGHARSGYSYFAWLEICNINPTTFYGAGAYNQTGMVGSIEA